MALENKVESTKQANCEGSTCDLGAYRNERPDLNMAASKDATSQMVQDGKLPGLMLADDGKDEKPELKAPQEIGQNIATKDLKDHDVSARKYKEDDGNTKVEVTTKSGITVDVVGPYQKHGHKIETYLIDGGDRQLSEDVSGDYVDNNGKKWAHQNKDGSITVDNGDGTFVKVDGHGARQATSLSDDRPPMQGKDVTSKEQKADGIKVTEEVSNGHKVQHTRYKTGIDVDTVDGKVVKVTGYDDAKEVKPGVFVDGEGRAIANVRKDGTIVVESGDGKFVEQGPEGIKKVTAIRNRDKSIDVLSDPYNTVISPEMWKQHEEEFSKRFGI